MCSMLLVACNLVPGTNLDEDNYLNSSNGAYQAQNKQLEHDLSKVNIHIINSELITQLKREQEVITTPLVSQEILKSKPYQYKIGVADILAINVWEHPELSTSATVQRSATFDGFRIQPDGTFNFAYAPKQQAAGRSISQIRTELTAELAQYIERPQVDIKVISFNSQKVYVSGEVKNPGIYAITDVPRSIIDVISLAGGLTSQANWRTVSFSRDNKTEIIRLDNFYRYGDIAQNKLLQHSDIIHIGRNDEEKVFVLGDIQKTGKVIIDRYGLSLAEALTESGGINENTANSNGIFVLRNRKKDNKVLADVFQLYAKNATAFILADQFQLQPNDIIYVTSAPIARWNRLISQLIPTIEDLNTIYDLRNNSNLF